MDALATAIWISLALNYAEVHGVDKGLQALDVARERADRAGDPRMSVRVHSQHAFVAMRAGRYEVAAAELARAERLIAHANDNDSFAILLNTGLLGLLNHDLTSARRALTRAIGQARRARMRVGEFKALHNLAYLEFLAGDLPLALRLMDEAGQIDADVSRGIWYLDRARVLAESGLIREADLALTDAAAIFRRDRLAQDLAEAELERARCALIAGDVSNARRLAASARDRFRRRGNDPWRRRAELVLLEGDLMAGRPGLRLVPPALRLSGELSAAGLPGPARTAALIAAEADMSAGRTDHAAEIFGGLTPCSRSDPVTLRLQDRLARARLAKQQGKRAEAARLVRRGLVDLARHQAGFGSVDLQTASAVHGRRLAQLGLELALERRAPAAVFAAAEQARSVSTRIRPVRPPSDSTAASLLAELRQVVEALRAVDQDRAAAAPLLRHRRELERAISARRWSQSGAGEAAPVAGMDDVQSALGASDATMVMYVEVGSALHAVVLGPDSARTASLGDVSPVLAQARRLHADLDVCAQPRLPNVLAGPVRQSMRRSAEYLDSSLLRPLGLSGGRLVIVSTGVLGQLPWGLFPSLSGVPVSVAASSTSWITARSRRAVSRRGSIVALAGPDLARASYEADGVAAQWPQGEVYREADSTCRQLREAMARASLVHVAAHGAHQTESPLFSSLRLADGVLFAHELDQAARTPDHVVLSACELGLATVRPGDEALGLTSVLLRLGTKAVVAGVARVGDEIAAETMIDYHRRLTAGVDSTAALAGAVAAADGVAPFVSFGADWYPPRFGDKDRRRVP